MTRENAQEKGRRYLAESRLRVLYVKPNDPRVRATCRGDGETYRLGFELVRGWFCECPAKTTDCSHLVALRLICEPTVEGPF